MTITNVAGKKTQGRKKIEIKKIEKTNTRQVTFSKRRTGLFKKASEICVLTGVEIAMLVDSPGGRLLFAFGHPNADILIDRYINKSNTAGADQPPLSKKEFNKHYVEVSRELEAEKKRTPAVKEGSVAWYNESIEDLNVEELEEYLCSLEELEKKATTKADELAMINKSSTFLASKTAVYGGLNYQSDAF